MHIGPQIVIKFDNGIFITNTVCFGIIVAVILIVLALWATRRMKKVPDGKQVIAEIVVEGVYNMVTATMGPKGINYAPYIGTLFFFVLFSNMLGLFGQRPVTADVNTTFALAAITFVLIQRQALKSYGLIGKMKEMAQPYPFMFPLKIIEQLSFPISLSFRLFGNILGGVIVIEMLLEGLATASEALHLPIPLLDAVIPMPANFFFDIFEPVLQAFIFTMLTMVFITMEIATRDEEH